MRKWLRAKIIIGLGVLLVCFLFGLFPHLITVYSPFQTDVWHEWDYTTPPFPPSKWHWLGTDDWGHDTYTQIIYGIVPTMRDATILVVLTIVCSLSLAIVTTLYKPRAFRFLLDTMSRTITLVPPLVLAILFLEIPAAYFGRGSAVWYYVVIAVLEIFRFTRIIEGDLQLIREKPFIEGAITAGCSPWQMFRRHYVPWLWPYLMEYIPTQYARILTFVGELAYFGLFNNVSIVRGAEDVYVQTKELDWATMIGLGSHDWFSFPTVLLFPTLAFCLFIFLFRLVASGVQDATTLERTQYWAWKTDESEAHDASSRRRTAASHP